MANSTVLSIDPNFLLLNTYSVSDENLISNQEVSTVFNPSTDYIEYYVYGLNNSLLYPSLEDGTIPYSSYSILNNELNIDPAADLEQFGFDQGEYNSLYNFYSNRLNSSFSTQYFISEISSDRTELRLDSNQIEDADIISSVTSFIQERDQDEYYPDFLLNFGSNRTVIANNIALDGATILIKLYEPLPPQFDLKSTLWVVEEVAEPAAYNVTFENRVLEEVDNSIALRGPNVNLGIKDEVNNSTEAVSLNELDTSPLTGSYRQLKSLFNNEGIQINVDYTEYSNFINFSSIEDRIENFEYKLQLIESYQQSAISGSNSPSATSVSGSKAYYENLIDDVITNFDGYEYFLYFESGSKSWPKSNSTPPYQNLSTDNAAAISWYNEQITSASLYDELNQDNLFYDIPEYLRNDSSNQQYIDFVGMVGQHFDNIWIYLKDISNKYNTDNRIDAGISKDLVAQTLRDFSLKIYQNNFSSKDIYSSFLGLTPSGSLFPFPEMTGSLPTPSGFEYVDTFISSSTDAIALDDINKRIYKRLYHNLPYLLKSKGTVTGLKTLLNTYGIPDTILRVSEFGGKDKDNSNDYDYWYNKYNYKFDTGTNGTIETDWETNSNWGSSPATKTIQFRFKTPGLESASTTMSQSLWTLDTDAHITLEYSGSASLSGSFSGSTPDPYNEYAYLKFYPDYSNNPNHSASLYLPFFDNGWWSVMATLDDGTISLSAGNNLYNGDTGTELGFYDTDSTSSVSSTEWLNGTTSTFASTSIYPKFSGSLQEIRYYNTVISENVFKDYIMNPLSFEGNSIASGSLDKAPDELLFRATLGGELYTGSTSIHPKVAGSWSTTSSFASDSDFTITNGSFSSNKEYIFFDQPAVGLKNRINDKIKAKELELPTYNKVQGALIPEADTLSNQRSIQQDKSRNDIYTNNVNLLEVTFSPQNELNDDIIQQLGHFNIGDLIGDPREISSTDQTYPELDKLRQEYFLKYVHENYDFNDYVRLIKFFDNSLFKMIQDFIPAKTSLASGITIKPTILERHKYPRPQPQWEDQQYTGSIKSFPLDYAEGSLQVTSGGTGGSLEKYNKPVVMFRVIDTQVPATSITSTPTVLLNQGIITISRPQRDGVGLIEDVSGGKFRNITGYDITGDIKVEIRNNQFQETFLLELVENGSKVVSSVRETLPQVSTPDVNSLILKNCLLKAGEEYHFQLSTTTAPAQIIGVVRAYFIQDDAPEAYRVGQMYSVTDNTPSGNLERTIVSQDEFINGEFSGSTISVSNGELNPGCDPFKKVSTTALTYDVVSLTYNSLGITSTYSQRSFSFFLNPPAPQFGTDGDVVLWWNSTYQGPSRTPGNFDFKYQIEAVKIYKESKNGVDNSLLLGNVNNIRLATSIFSVAQDVGDSSFTTTSNLNLQVTSVAEYPDFYLYYVTPVGSIILTSPNGTPGAIDVSTQSNIVTIPSPYITKAFNVSDCNVTYGNASEIRPGTLYQDIDYSANATTPVNFDQLISGSADKALVPDSNYSTKRITQPRYEGSRSTAGENFNSNSTQGGLGSLPNVEQDRAYFAYFNWVGGTAPEWGNGLEDRSSLSIRYFVDVDGNVIEPTKDSKDINLSIVRQTFTEGETSVLSFDDEGGASANFGNLIGEQTVFKSGKTITPIVYSQTQSISDTTPGGYTGSLTFVQGDQQEGAAGDYRLTAYPTVDFQNSQTIDLPGTVTFVDPPQYSGSLVDDFSNSIYTLKTGVTPPYQTTPSSSLIFTAELEDKFKANNGSSAEFVIQKDTGGVGTWQDVSLAKTIIPGVVNNITLTFTDTNVNIDDEYRLQVTDTTSGNNQGDFVYLSNKSSFKVTQTPPPAIGAIGGGTDYWQKVGGVPNKIKPNALMAAYGQKQQNIEEDVNGDPVGFFPIVNDFILQVGDEIRFRGTETQTYKIIELDDSPANGDPLHLILDRDVNLTNTEMNWFLVRRYVDAPGNIIIEADKPAGGTSPGFFVPLYTTKGIEDNFDNIIQKLKTDQLI